MTDGWMEKEVQIVANLPQEENHPDGILSLLHSLMSSSSTANPDELHSKESISNARVVRETMVAYV